METDTKREGETDTHTKIDMKPLLSLSYLFT